MSKTIARHIRIDAEHWRRIGSLANERRTTPNQLLVELAVEALEHREWPQNPIEIQMHRSCLFTAQATARDMISTGRRDEVDDSSSDTMAVGLRQPSLPPTDGIIVPVQSPPCAAGLSELPPAFLVGQRIG